MKILGVRIFLAHFFFVKLFTPSGSCQKRGMDWKNDGEIIPLLMLQPI